MSAFLKNSLRRSWKVWGLVAVVLTALASSGYAYWTSNSPAPSLYVTATKPPMEVRMELDKTEFQLNETVAIHLLLKNIGDRTIKIFVPYLGHFVGFIVKDANGAEVFDSLAGGICTVDEATLEPYSHISRTSSWVQIGKYPHDSGGVDLHPVPLGTYYIMGRTGQYSIDSFEDALWIETPPIAITIS